MASRHVCPKCGGTRFDTTAHVMQAWEVDEHGEFISVISDCLQITHHPDDDNLWTCLNCGENDIIKTEKSV